MQYLSCASEGSVKGYFHYELVACLLEIVELQGTTLAKCAEDIGKLVECEAADDPIQLSTRSISLLRDASYIVVGRPRKTIVRQGYREMDRNQGRLGEYSRLMQVDLQDTILE